MRQAELGMILEELGRHEEAAAQYGGSIEQEGYRLECELEKSVWPIAGNIHRVTELTRPVSHNAYARNLSKSGRHKEAHDQCSITTSTAPKHEDINTRRV